MITLEWVLSGLGTLIAGSYGFTAWVYRELRKVTGNHLLELEARVRRAEHRLDKLEHP